MTLHAASHPERRAIHHTKTTRHDPTTSAAVGAQQYSSAEWEQLKHLIEKWYIDDNRTLREVRIRLERERSFCVTERMIRTRLQKWGFDCKNARFHKSPGTTGDSSASPESSASSSDGSTASAQMRHTQAVARRRLTSQASPLPDPFIPHEQSRYDQALCCAQLYSDLYSSIPDAAIQHPEPRVHRETQHAIFGERMADGLSLLRTPHHVRAAFTHVDAAFARLAALLRDPHPMSTAQILITLTQTPAHPALSAALTAHLAQLAATLLTPTHPLAALYRALHGVAEPRARADLAVRTLRRLRDGLAATLGERHWKALYVANATCDALYHAGDGGRGVGSGAGGERRRARQKLLTAQAAVYGAGARNVLWTRANVADDDLQAGELARSEVGFREVLQRAEEEGYTGYDLAKTRFVALEGLGSVFAVRASVTARRIATVEEIELRQMAVGFFEEAETVAREWFDGSSRRLTRITEKKEAVLRVMGPGVANECVVGVSAC